MSESESFATWQWVVLAIFVLVPVIGAAFLGGIMRESAESTVLASFGLGLLGCMLGLLVTLWPVGMGILLGVFALFFIAYGVGRFIAGKGE
jgi:hypothetical protein